MSKKSRKSGNSPFNDKSVPGVFSDGKNVTTPKKEPSKPLPPWNVMLHNDDKIDRVHVVKTLKYLLNLTEEKAIELMKEAEARGMALLLTTHKELAELKRDQLKSKSLTATIEPAR